MNRNDIEKLIDFSKMEYNWEEIEKIEEFSKLEECEQSNKWHGEGNALIHTKMVCSEMVSILQSNNVSGNVKEVLMTAALFHDIGKGVTTEFKKGDWHSYGHEFESERITRLMLWNCGIGFRENVCKLVRYHMEPLRLFENSKRGFLDSIAELSCKCESVFNLCLLKLADIEGSVISDKDRKKRDIDKISMILENCIHMNCANQEYCVNFRRDLKNKQTIDIPVTVTVMVGISGAGKDTFIEKRKWNSERTVVSRDSIRESLGMCVTGEKCVCSNEDEDKVSAIMNETIIDSVKSGKHVVINNMNTRRKYRDSYKDLLSGMNVKWNYVYVEADGIEENIKRRNGQVSKDIIESMIYNIDWPTHDEYDSIEYFVSSDVDIDEYRNSVKKNHMDNDEFDYGHDVSYDS